MIESCDPPDQRLPCIGCERIVVQFSQSQRVLDELTGVFRAGEITAIVGPSGCGKSTLLRAMAGLQPIQSGELKLEPMARADAGEIAFVFQQPGLLPWRTAIENVYLPLQLVKSDNAGGDAAQATSSTMLQRAEQQLQAMQLPQDSFHRFPRQLSGGMRMRVSLARAMVTKPRVLLLDEPFAAIDDMLRNRLGDLLLSTWQQHRFTGVMVTHNIAEAAMLSHRVLVMSQGKFTAELENPLPWPRTEELKSSQQFGTFYGQISAALRH